MGDVEILYSDNLVDGTPISPAPVWEHQPAATNVLAYSDAFDNAVWVKNIATVSPDAVISPNGSVDADKLISNNGVNGHISHGITGLTTSAHYTSTIYIKKADLQYAFVWYHDGAGYGYVAEVDLDAGTIRATYSTTDGKYDSFAFSIALASSGFYRIALSARLLTVTNVHLRVYFSDIPHTVESYGTAAYTGDGSSGNYLWGAQFEQSRVASAFIPTAGAAASRAEPVHKYPIAGNADETKGMVVVKGWVPGFDETVISAAQGIVGFQDASLSALHNEADGDLGSADGTGTVSKAFPFTEGNEYNLAEGWNAATLKYYVGYRDVTGAGSWQWSTIDVFDGAFTVGSFLQLFYSNTYPQTYKDIIIYARDKGRAFIEAAY